METRAVSDVPDSRDDSCASGLDTTAKPEQESEDAAGNSKGGQIRRNRACSTLSGERFRVGQGRVPVRHTACFLIIVRPIRQSTFAARRKKRTQPIGFPVDAAEIASSTVASSGYSLVRNARSGIGTSSIR